MKRVNLIVIFSITFIILVGIISLDYGGENFYYITGSATNQSDACGEWCNDGIVDVQPGLCSESGLWYCPISKDKGDCGYLTEACEKCGCFSDAYDCQPEGHCLLGGGEGEGEGEPTHNECLEVTEGVYSCAEFPGEGLNQCQIDADCYDTYHSVCNEDPAGNYCQTELGPGRNQCDLEGCLPSYLERCDDFTWNDECRIASSPLFCVDGVFVDDCSTCGCPPGLDCQEDGSCLYDDGGEDNFEDLVYISTISVGLDKNIYIKDLMESKIKSTLEFERPEIPIMRFIRPTITEMSLELPDKPDIEKVESVEEVLSSPPTEVEKMVVIRGVKKLPSGLQLSPGIKKPREFEMVIGKIGNNPYIGLSFPDLDLL